MQGTKKPKFFKINYVEELTLSDLKNYPHIVSHISTYPHSIFATNDAKTNGY